MKIKDLKEKMKGVDLKVKVIEKNEYEITRKDGVKVPCASFRIKDDTEECNLSVFSEQIKNANKGDIIIVSSAYCKCYYDGSKGGKAGMDVTLGRFGTIKKSKNV